VAEVEVAGGRRGEAAEIGWEIRNHGVTRIDTDKYRGRRF
jgi:hypothetical protein